MQGILFMAENKNHAGHRKRLRETIVKNSNGFFHDYQLLEMLLTYSIPRKDVKPIAHELINQFKTLENVFNASKDELMSIDGIGESSADLIVLSSIIQNKINTGRNDKIKKISNSKDAIEFASNILSSQPVECFLIINLTSSFTILNYHLINHGSSSKTIINKQEVIKKILTDSPAAVIIAHNHPNNTSNPSIEDIDFTVNFSNYLQEIGIRLIDHVIIGKNEATCMSEVKGIPDIFHRKSNR